MTADTREKRARELRALLEALEGELAAQVGLAPRDATILELHERKALDIASSAAELGDAASLAVALRLSALAASYRRDWCAPRAQVAARLRLADRLLRQRPLGDSAPEDVFELAKVQTVRASVLEQAYKLRSLRGMRAAHRLFASAEALFSAVGATTPAALQRAYMAQAAFSAGTLGDLDAYRSSAADFARAAESASADISPEQRAVWTGYRGSALGALAENGHPQYFEPAVASMRDALKTLDGSPRAREIAMIRLSLGGLLMHSRRRQWRSDIDESIAHLLAARDLPHGDDALRSAIDYTLCAAYQFSPGGTLTRNIEHAIAYGERAYAAIDATLAPVDKAKAAENLGMAYASRVLGERGDNFARAMQLIEHALSLTSRTQNPTAWSDREGNAGHILFFHANDEPSRYARAYLRFMTALRARPAAQRLSGPAGIIRQKAALALLELHAHHPRACLLGAAARQARAAVDAFAADADVEGRRRALVIEADCAAAAGDWQNALRVLEQARALQQLEPDAAREQWVSFATSTRSLGSYAHMHGAAAYCAVRIGRADYALAILESAKANALAKALGLSPAVTQNDLLAARGDDAVAIAPVFHRDGAAVLVARLGGGRPEIVDVVHLAGVTRQSLVDVLHLGTARTPPLSQALHDDEPGPIARAVEAAAAWQWAHVVEPVAKSLDRHLGGTAARLVLSPHAGSGALPWHAAGPSQGRFPRQPGPLWSRWRMTYMPSLRLLASAPRWRAPQGGLATISDPTGDISANECRRIAALVGGPHAEFGAHNCTPEAIFPACSGVGALHFCGHAAYDPFEPHTSKLYLGEQTGLSVADIAQRMKLTGAPLVTLAGCETGVADYTERSDEFLGLPAAFLAAGAGCVVASQWKVSDQASRAFFIDLYRRIFRLREAPADAVVATATMLSALSPDEALAGDEGWSFDEEAIEDAIAISGTADRPFSHPFYWAPFVLIGRGW